MFDSTSCLECQICQCAKNTRGKPRSDSGLCHVVERDYSSIGEETCNYKAFQLLIRRAIRNKPIEQFEGSRAVSLGQRSGQ